MANLLSTCKTKRRVVSSASFSKAELDVALQLLLLSREAVDVQWDINRCILEGKREARECDDSTKNEIIFGEEKQSAAAVYPRPRRKKRSRPLADLYGTTEHPSFLHVKRSRSMTNDIL